MAERKSVTLSADEVALLRSFFRQYNVGQLVKARPEWEALLKLCQKLDVKTVMGKAQTSNQEQRFVASSEDEDTSVDIPLCNQNMFARIIRGTGAAKNHFAYVVYYSDSRNIYSTGMWRTTYDTALLDLCRAHEVEPTWTSHSSPS